MNTGRDSGVHSTRDGGESPDAGPATCLPGWGLGDACGGALDGSWTLREICGGGWFERALQDVCPGALVTSAAVSGSGRLSFDEAAETYSVSQAIAVNADFNAGLCSRDPCTETEIYVTLALASGGTTTCTRNGDRCNCNYQGSLGFTQDGDFERQGNQFVLDPGGVDEITFPYCVEGMKLTYAQRGTTFIADR